MIDWFTAKEIGMLFIGVALVVGISIEQLGDIENKSKEDHENELSKGDDG